VRSVEAMIASDLTSSIGRVTRTCGRQTYHASDVRNAMTQNAEYRRNGKIAFVRVTLTI